MPRIALTNATIKMIGPNGDGIVRLVNMPANVKTPNDAPKCCKVI